MKNTINEQLVEQVIRLLPNIPKVSDEWLGYFSCGKSFYVGAKEIVTKYIQDKLGFSEAAALSYFEEFFKADNEDDHFVEFIFTPVFLKLQSKTDESVAGANDGALEVVAYGGTAPYEYSIDSGTGQASGVFTGLADGNHTVTVTDDEERTFSLTVNIAAGE